jgi:hypothetical protein
MLGLDAETIEFVNEYLSFTGIELTDKKKLAIFKGISRIPKYTRTTENIQATVANYLDYFSYDFYREFSLDEPLKPKSFNFSEKVNSDSYKLEQIISGSVKNQSGINDEHLKQREYSRERVLTGLSQEVLDFFYELSGGEHEFSVFLDTLDFNHVDIQSLVEKVDMLKSMNPEERIRYADETLISEMGLEKYFRRFFIGRKKLWTGEKGEILLEQRLKQAFFEIPGYKEAELSRDREKQISILNDAMNNFNLIEFLYTKNLRMPINKFVKSKTGGYGLEKSCSLISVLEFYSEKNDLNWFDRSQPHHLKRWKINYKDKWNSGAESIELALNAIQDVLYNIPGYMHAEINGDREEQIKILSDFFDNYTLKDFFKEKGFSSLLANFTRNENNGYGLKDSTFRSLFEFYSESKNLDWFDRERESYLSLWKIPSGNKWILGEESIDLALEAISDSLRCIEGYKEAEIIRKRDTLVELIDNYLEQNNYSLGKLFSDNRLKGLLDSFVDVKGEKGIKKKYSAIAALEFYDAYNGLGFFDKSYENYVKKWRIKEGNKWNSGEHSVDLALNAIQDVLYEIPGYRQAEFDGDLKKAFKIVQSYKKERGDLRGFFRKRGLSGMMTEFYDISGLYGFKKKNSPNAILEFYFERKIRQTSLYNSYSDLFIEELPMKVSKSF